MTSESERITYVETEARSAEAVRQESPHRDLGAGDRSLRVMVDGYVVLLMRVEVAVDVAPHVRRIAQRFLRDCMSDGAVKTDTKEVRRES